MNIYLLNGTQTAFLPAHLLVQQLPVKGLIGLANTEANRALNEYYDYAAFCEETGIEYIALDSYSMQAEQDRQILLTLEIDIILCISWQRLLPVWLIDHCKIGVVGSHGSPEGISGGRGRSPQNWALLLGCRQFSYSIFWIDAGMDSGKVIDTTEFAYSDVDDIMTSYIKAGLAMVDMMVKNYRNGNLQHHYGQPQADDAPYYLPQRTREDGLIDWCRTAKNIYNFVRALTRPYPGAYTLLNDKTISIWQGKYIDDETNLFAASQPGEVLLVYPNGEVLVRCGDGLFLITEYDEACTAIVAGAQFESADFTQQLQAIVGRHRAKYDFLVSPLVTEHLPLEKGGEAK